MERKLKKALKIGDFDSAKYGFIRYKYRALRMRLNWLIYGFPSQVLIETNRDCNLKCQYCAASQMVKDGTLNRHRMSLSELEVVLQKLRNTLGRSIRAVGLGGLQEPLMDQHLADYILLARSYFPKALLAVTTNGVLLNRRNAEKLIGKIDGLCVSLNSFDRETYLRLNGADFFDVVVKNLREFLLLKGSLRPFTEIQLLNTPENRANFQAFVDYWRCYLSSIDKLKLHDIHSWGGNLRDFNMPAYEGKRHPCVQLWDYLYVDCEGDIYPCCLGEVAADLKLGNIYSGPLKSALDSKKLKELRKAHLNGVYPLNCYGCWTWREKYAPMLKVGSRWI